MAYAEMRCAMSEVRVVAFVFTLDTHDLRPYLATKFFRRSWAISYASKAQLNIGGLRGEGET